MKSDQTPLPRAIGKPAMRALNGRGYFYIEQLAGLKEADLLTLHGVGPKATTVIRQALKECDLGFAAAWPSIKNEFADKFNSMPKYVVSTKLTKPTWNNTTVLSGDVAEEVAKLKKSLKGNIVVHGSTQLAQALVQNDLVDELRLMVFPVVLGTGKRLFGSTTDKKRFTLASSKTVGDGVVILIYRPA